MFHYLFENVFQEISNVTVLHIAACDSRTERAKRSSDCADRFLKAAFTLSEGEYLGWEFGMKAEKPPVCRVFSSPNTEVCEADFQWIFKARISESRDMNPQSEDRFRKDRHIYALYPKQPGKNEKDNEKDGRSYNSCTYTQTWSMENFECLVDMMKEVRDVYIRVFAFGDAEHNHSGLILISLPEKLSLRLKVAILSAFPNTGMKEWNGKPEDTINPLPSSQIKGSIECLLQILMTLDDAQKMISLENILEDWVDAEFPDNTDLLEKEEPDRVRVITGVTGIEELRLNMRPYHCLRRAGIDMVEKLRTMSDEELMKVRNLGRKGIIEIREKLASLPPPKKETVLTAKNYRAMLDELIGLKEVKEQVKKIAAYAKLKRDMLSAEAAHTPPVLNMAFVGNPGTAKTTVARILAGIFHEIGLLGSSDMVEVGRADLIGKYAGHTADNVKNVFKAARGKLLFIDEAYSLLEHWEGGYGDEAIDTIVQEMENHRDETVVIFAGYPKEMEEFFSRNPGLYSRVPFKITFCDYSAEEMEEIVKLEAKKRGFSIQEEAGPRVSELCRNIAKNAAAGNGRFCRNLVENAILEYAMRIYGGDDRKSKANIVLTDFVLTASDFTRWKPLQSKEKAHPIGFQASQIPSGTVKLTTT